MDESKPDRRTLSSRRRRRQGPANRETGGLGRYLITSSPTHADSRNNN